MSEVGKGLEIEYLPINKLKPYKRNAKKHPQWQVDQIARSIEEFGMNDPIAVYGKDNEIVEGHGRLLACKQLNYNEVPVIHLDWLTDEQRKAYNLVHNKLTMNSDFDLKTLSQELDSILDLDMGDFGFDVAGIQDEWEEQHEENKYQEQLADGSILNMEKARFPGVGQFDIPEILPVKEIPPVKEWIGFNYVLSDTDPEGKGVHFFLNDYQFERLWNNPDRYIEKLSRYAVVASPDFSPYADMPFCLQVYNHYRKHWVARYLQEAGVTVIPTITASTDERSLSWFLDGEPHEGVVITSTMWTTSKQEKEYFKKMYDLMYDTLTPAKVLFYGKNKAGDLRGDIECIPAFTERWNK